MGYKEKQQLELGLSPSRNAKPRYRAFLVMLICLFSLQWSVMRIGPPFRTYVSTSNPELAFVCIPSFLSRKGLINRVM